MDRKKVIIAETLYPYGHVTLNDRFIDCIINIADVTVVNNNNYFTPKSIQKCKTLNVYQFKPKYFEIFYTICYIINLVIVAWKIRKEDYDKIIFLSTRIDSMFFVYRLFKKDSIIVVHHNDIDRMLNRPFEFRVFKRYMNDIYHVVLADFIKDELMANTGVDNSKVFVVYQPSVNEKQLEDLHISNKINKIIGIGQSISQDVIDEIVNIYETEKPLLANSLFLKSKNQAYKGEQLVTYSGYLKREVFNELLEQSVGCLVFYNSNYNLRYSGIIDDALHSGLRVYCNDIPVCRYFSEKYPNTCKIVESARDFMSQMVDTIEPADEEEIRLFLSEHSESNVSLQWSNVISNG